MVNQIITRLDPSPTKEGSPVIPAGSPFYTAPSSRILCVSIDIVTDRAINYSWMLFVFPESLLDDPYPDSPGGIPWSEWGPDNTRLVPLNDNQLTWVCYVHGTRFVTLIPHDDVQLGEVPSSRLHVYEFSPLLLRRGMLVPALSLESSLSSPFRITWRISTRRHRIRRDRILSQNSRHHHRRRRIRWSLCRRCRNTFTIP